MESQSRVLKYNLGPTGQQLHLGPWGPGIWSSETKARARAGKDRLGRTGWERRVGPAPPPPPPHPHPTPAPPRWAELLREGVGGGGANPEPSLFWEHPSRPRLGLLSPFPQ